MKRGGPIKRKTRLRPVSRKKSNDPWKDSQRPELVITLNAPTYSTVSRTESNPQPKDGRFDCKALREWVKRQACIVGPTGCQGPTDPHHFPTKGAGGDDLGIIPVCRKHHDEMQQYRGIFTHENQYSWARQTLVKFIRNACEEERVEFFRAWQDYAEQRVYTELPF